MYLRDSAVLSSSLNGCLICTSLLLLDVPLIKLKSGIRRNSATKELLDIYTSKYIYGASDLEKFKEITVSALWCCLGQQPNRWYRCSLNPTVNIARRQSPHG